MEELRSIDAVLILFSAFESGVSSEYSRLRAHEKTGPSKGPGVEVSRLRRSEIMN